jgi:hypothetical protein
MEAYPKGSDILFSARQVITGMLFVGQAVAAIIASEGRRPWRTRNLGDVYSR